MNDEQKYDLDVIKQAKLDAKKEMQFIEEEIDRLTKKINRTAIEEETLTLLKAQTKIYNMNLLLEVQQIYTESIYRGMRDRFQLKSEAMLAVQIALQSGLVIGSLLFIIERIVSILEGSSKISPEWILISITVLTIFFSSFMLIKNYFDKQLIKLSTRASQERREFQDIIERIRQETNNDS